jgi:hypothetical protein
MRTSAENRRPEPHRGAAHSLAPSPHSSRPNRKPAGQQAQRFQLFTHKMSGFTTTFRTGSASQISQTIQVIQEIYPENRQSIFLRFSAAGPIATIKESMSYKRRQYIFTAPVKLYRAANQHISNAL